MITKEFKTDEFQEYKEYWEGKYLGKKLKHHYSDFDNLELGDLVTHGVHCSGVWLDPYLIDEEWFEYMNKLSRHSEYMGNGIESKIHRKILGDLAKEAIAKRK
jgi:light-regulated signal transduction histidine kinase (bacteriophytochrome)